MTIQLSDSSGSLPLAVPTAGVATKWKVESLLANKPQVLKVVRPTGKKNEFRVVGKSTEQTVVSGLNTFDTRIPVQPGDQFGLYGATPSGALYCTGAIAKPTDVMGTSRQPPADRGAPVFGEFKSARVAVSVIVEPDVDGDGFGDETQDKCPQSAAFQGECPQISLDQFAVVGKSSITLLVIADHEAPVTVTGTNRDQSGRALKRRPKAGSSTSRAEPRRSSRGRSSSSSSLLREAEVAAPRPSPRQVSEAGVTASTKNHVGQIFKKTTTVKLKGQG